MARRTKPNIQRDPNGPGYRASFDARDRQGKRHRLTEVYATKHEAETAWHEFRAAVKLGTWVHPDARGKQIATERGPTFAEFAQRFLRDYRGRGATKPRSTYYRDIIVGRRPDHPRPILATFGDRYMAELALDRAAFEKFRGDRLDRDRANPGTVRKELVCLSTMFTAAMRWSDHPTEPTRVTANPVLTVTRPSETLKLTESFTHTEWTAALDAADPDVRTIMLAAFVFGGRRLREPCGLRWAEDVHLDRGYVTFSRHNKTGTAFTIPVGEVARTLLDKAGTRFSGGPVFVDGDGAGWDTDKGRNRVSQRTSAAFKDHGGHSFKSIRATVTRVLDLAGFPEADIQDALSHAANNSVLRKHYLQRPPEMIADRLRPLIAALDAWHAIGDEAFSGGRVTDTLPVASGAGPGGIRK